MAQQHQHHVANRNVNGMMALAKTSYNEYDLTPTSAPDVARFDNEAHMGVLAFPKVKVGKVVLATATRRVADVTQRNKPVYGVGMVPARFQQEITCEKDRRQGTILISRPKASRERSHAGNALGALEHRIDYGFAPQYAVNSRKDGSPEMRRATTNV
jgi:hypothetical protein